MHGQYSAMSCLRLQKVHGTLAARQVQQGQQSSTWIGPIWRTGAKTAAFSSMLSSPKKLTCSQDASPMGGTLSSSAAAQDQLLSDMLTAGSKAVHACA